eukprot:m.44633 g.44633  ORF g.44633 m.44633 type:complete len:308 (+) comp6205_c0_seq1:625-1548(+)
MASAAAAAAVASASSAGERAPVFFLSHGGGPSWFMIKGSGIIGQMDAHSKSRQFMDRARKEILEQQGGIIGLPRAIIVVSAHWESSVPATVQVTTASDPGLLYDYYGFPPETYEPHLTYPAKGDPELAERILGMLQKAGIKAQGAPKRQFDHGMFIPLKLLYPQADVPVVQVSLQSSLDPEAHVNMGKTLAPLRDEGYLIIGSGQATHNLGAGFEARSTQPDWARNFVDWLEDVLTGEGKTPAERLEAIKQWSKAPGARQAHPREEHLIPLLVCAGAAWPTSDDKTAATCVFTDWASHMAIAHYLFV